MSGLAGERFDVKIVGVTKSVRTSQGLTVPVQAIGSRPPDCAVVPAIGFKMPEPLTAALARPDDHLVHSDPIVQRFEEWTRARLKHGFSLDQAAKAVGSSKRTLARHMQSVLGKS